MCVFVCGSVANMLTSLLTAVVLSVPCPVLWPSAMAVTLLLLSAISRASNARLERACTD